MRTGGRLVLSTVIVVAVVAVCPLAVAVKVTSTVPALSKSGVHANTPDGSSNVAPAGKPLAVTKTLSPSASSLATMNERGCPSDAVIDAGAVTVGARSVWVTVTEMARVPIASESFAISVKAYVPASENEGVQAKTPVVSPKLAPAGRPLASKVRAGPSGSLTAAVNTSASPSATVSGPSGVGDTKTGASFDSVTTMVKS